MNMLTSRRHFHLALGACAATLALSPSAHATTVLALSLEEMVARSQRATVGTPVHYSSEWAFIGGGRRIVTYTRVLQEENLLLDGSGEEEILIMTLGGQVGNLRQKVPGEAALPVGERALVFATPELTDGTRRVVGMAQGKYSVEKDGHLDIVRPSRRLPHLVRRAQPDPDRPPPPTAVENLDGKTVEEARRLVRSFQ